MAHRDAAMPIDRIWGSDINGRPFNQAVSVSLSHAAGELQLEPVGAEVAVGEMVGATIQDQRCRARVLACEAAPGGFRLRVMPDAKLNLEPPAPEPAAQEAARGVDRRQGERRAHPRLALTGTVHVSASQASPAAAMKFTDISAGGCYIESFAPAAVGSEFNVRLCSEEVLDCSARAIVRVCHAQMGMGVQFLSFVNDEDRENLIAFLRSHGVECSRAGGPVALTPDGERLRLMAAELVAICDQSPEADDESRAILRAALERAVGWIQD